MSHVSVHNFSSFQNLYNSLYSLCTNVVYVENGRKKERKNKIKKRKMKK